MNTQVLAGCVVAFLVVMMIVFLWNSYVKGRKLAKENPFFDKLELIRYDGQLASILNRYQDKVDIQIAKSKIVILNADKDKIEKL